MGRKVERSIVYSIPNLLTQTNLTLSVVLFLRIYLSLNVNLRIDSMHPFSFVLFESICITSTYGLRVLVVVFGLNSLLRLVFVLRCALMNYFER